MVCRMNSVLRVIFTHASHNQTLTKHCLRIMLSTYQQAYPQFGCSTEEEYLYFLLAIFLPFSSFYCSFIAR